MKLKTLRNSLLVFLCILLSLYLILVVSFGGLGSAAPNPLQQLNAPLVFAHRGHSQYPENSKEAFQAALKHGFTGIELDIRLSKDGIPVVFHDAHGDRLLHKNIEIHTQNAAEITSHLLHHNDSISDSHPLLLDEVFATFKTNTLYYLDIKVPNGTMYEKVRDCIQKHGLLSHAIIASNSYEFLLRFKWNNPKFMVIQEDLDSRNQWTYHLIPNELKPDFIGGSLLHVDESHAKWLEKNNLIHSKIVYDVNPETVYLLKKWKLNHSIQDL
jgi:glycerophosphoryl diester phosphodiesterase